jgi:hypothetical protein
MTKKEPGQLGEGWRIVITVWGFALAVCVVTVAVIFLTNLLKPYWS